MFFSDLTSIHTSTSTEFSSLVYISSIQVVTNTARNCVNLKQLDHFGDLTFSMTSSDILTLLLMLFQNEKNALIRDK